MTATKGTTWRWRRVWGTRFYRAVATTEGIEYPMAFVVDDFGNLVLIGGLS